MLLIVVPPVLILVNWTVLPLYSSRFTLRLPHRRAPRRVPAFSRFE